MFGRFGFGPVLFLFSGQYARWFVCPVGVTCALPSEDFGLLFWFSTWTVFDLVAARRSQPCLHLA